MFTAENPLLIDEGGRPITMGLCSLFWPPTSGLGEAMETTPGLGSRNPRNETLTRTFGRLLNFMRKGKWDPPGAAADETSRKTPGLQMSKSDGLSLIWAPVPSNSRTLTAQVPYSFHPSESLFAKRVQCECLILRVKLCIWRAWPHAWHIANFHNYVSQALVVLILCPVIKISKSQMLTLNPFRPRAVPHNLLFICTSLRFF